MSALPDESGGEVLPFFEPETGSVCFSVQACGATVRAFVTGDWMRRRFGAVVPDGPRLIETYVEHAEEIGVEVARRYAHGRLDPVWLACASARHDD